MFAIPELRAGAQDRALLVASGASSGNRTWSLGSTCRPRLRVSLDGSVARLIDLPLPG